MIEFEVLQVFNVTNRGQFIMVRQINSICDFTINKGASLGNFELEEFLDAPRNVTGKDDHLEDIYILKPKQQIENLAIIEGSVLSLAYQSTTTNGLR